MRKSDAPAIFLATSKLECRRNRLHYLLAEADLSMRQLQSKTLTHAAQHADLLVSDNWEAHNQACDTESALGILLHNLTGDAPKIKNPLNEVEQYSQ